MEYYMQALRRYTDFEGRSRRKEYWMFVLINFVISFALSLTGALLDSFLIEGVSLLYSLAVFLPSLAVAVRRLHDIGRSGWWLLIAFIPLIGFIILIVWFATDGTPGENKWGRNPKELGDEISDHLVV